MQPKGRKNKQCIFHKKMAIQEIVVVYHLQGESGSSTVCEDAK